MKKSKSLTFFLSFVPGTGHLYLGLMNRGLQFLLLFFGAMFISNLLVSELFEFLLPVIWIYCLFDALQQYNKIQETNEVIDTPIIELTKFIKSNVLIGWALIAFGVFLFIEKFFLQNYGWLYSATFRTVLFAVMLIIIGIYLLMGRKIKKSSNTEVE
ncbi:MAG: hypothetical protein AB7V16_10150 [Vulcanibacillus sp.]